MPELDPLLLCPGPATRRKQWERNVAQREQAMQQLRDYLEEPACVGSLGADVSGCYPYLDVLGEAFVALIRLELGTHTDMVESLRSMRSIAAVLGEYWRLVSRVGDRHPKMEFGPDKLRAFVELSTRPALDADERVRHADMLTKAFTKAYAETRLAMDKNDHHSVQHHRIIMNDYVNEMLNLAQYLKLRDDTELTEFELAASGQ